MDTFCEQQTCLVVAMVKTGPEFLPLKTSSSKPCCGTEPSLSCDIPWEDTGWNDGQSPSADNAFQEKAEHLPGFILYCHFLAICP